MSRPDMAETPVKDDDFYCRLCASRLPPHSLRSFSATETDSVSLFSAIRRLRAGIRRADGLPQAACLDCARLLHAVDMFLRRVAAAQLILAGLFPRILINNIKKEETRESDPSHDDPTYDRDFSDNEDNRNLLTQTSIKGEDDVISEENSGKHEATKERSADRAVQLKGGTTSTQGPRWSDYWRCRRCDHHAASLQRLREHSWREHARCVVFKCALCSVRMFTYKHFLQHMRRHLAALSRCCEHCDEQFVSVAAAGRHRELRHPAEIAPHLCANCGSSFATPAALQAHRDSYTVVRASTAGGRLFRCEHCPKAFANKIGLLGHMDCHDPDKNTCNACNKTYKNKYILSQHRLFVHSDQVQFICQICGKGFKKKSDLKGHLDVHNGIKPYSCKVCVKKFRTDIQLKAHQICHTGENSFVCNICSKTYKYRSGLRDHLRAHNNERPYSCNMCSDKSFISWSNYNKHMKAIHNKNMARNQIQVISR